MLFRWRTAANGILLFVNTLLFLGLLSSSVNQEHELKVRQREEPRPPPPPLRPPEPDPRIQDSFPKESQPNGFKWNFDWDRRHHHWQNGSQRHAVRQLFLVRHGQYYKTGDKMRHLTPLGEKQAAKAGERLRDMNITFDTFVASTSIRAQETAMIIHKYLPYVSIRESELLREGWPTFPEPPFPLWKSEDPAFAVDGDRLSRAFSKYIHRAEPDQKRNSVELIVAHGNVIGYFVLRLLQVTPERWLRLAVQQGSITRVFIHPDGHVTVKAVGDVGHLKFPEWTD